MTYQWFKNGNSISGATSATLSLPNVQPTDVGTYTVRVTNSLGNVTTASGGVLTVLLDTLPSFTLSPTSATVSTGRSAVFNAIATGVPAPTLQWTLTNSTLSGGSLTNSTAIPGAGGITTDPILLISGATASNIGTYYCTATNSSGSAIVSATLGVDSGSLTPGYLTDVSARGYVGIGAGILIGGMNISGSGFKQVLIRGIGPGLSTISQAYGGQFNGYLVNPFLELFTGITPLQTSGGAIVQNDDWGTPVYPGAGTGSAIGAKMATLGAFTLPGTSQDAAILIGLSAGGCSAEVSGVGGGTGTGLVEVYDADTQHPSPTRLVNLSARDLVKTGQDILIGGFAIGGGSTGTAETVLVRAVGPTLGTSPYNVPGVLAQPVLTLFDDGSRAGENGTPKVIASNTGWGGDLIVTNVENAVGAFSLASSSADSILLVTLPPGGYTAQVTGLGGTTGIALVEIYEVY